MQILNITGAHIKLPIGSEGKLVKNGTISDHIILTPKLLKESIFPLAMMYKGKFKISVNSSELGVFDGDGRGFPPEYIVELPQMKKELQQYINQQKKPKK